MKTTFNDCLLLLLLLLAASTMIASSMDPSGGAVSKTTMQIDDPQVVELFPADLVKEIMKHKGGEGGDDDNEDENTYCPCGDAGSYCSTPDGDLGRCNSKGDCETDNLVDVCPTDPFAFVECECQSPNSPDNNAIVCAYRDYNPITYCNQIIVPLVPSFFIMPCVPYYNGGQPKVYCSAGVACDSSRISNLSMYTNLCAAFSLITD